MLSYSLKVSNNWVPFSPPLSLATLKELKPILFWWVCQARSLWTSLFFSGIVWDLWKLTDISVNLMVELMHFIILGCWILLVNSLLNPAMSREWIHWMLLDSVQKWYQKGNSAWMIPLFHFNFGFAVNLLCCVCRCFIWIVDIFYCELVIMI